VGDRTRPRPDGCYTLPIAMLRVLLGIFKGAIVGGAIGYAATQLGVQAGPMAYATYAVVGFVVGLVCGKAVWRQETLWTPALKGLFGALVSMGLYWGATKVLGGLNPPFAVEGVFAADRPVVQIPLLVAPVLAIVYGIFVEVDDGERKAAAAGQGRAPQ